ncbi:hypothetical protein J2W42_003951 [Rhizobium tibeticum]|nr:hypothetical protein [Rhizobium tibeticum]
MSSDRRVQKMCIAPLPGGRDVSPNASASGQGQAGFVMADNHSQSQSSVTMYAGTCSSKNFENDAMRGGSAW